MRAWLLGGLVLVASGCWELLPASKDPVRDAEHREPDLCGRGAVTYPDGLFSPQAVVAVAPHYFTRSVRGSQDEHLLGASLSVVPPHGVTSQELERLFNCHAVRTQLQREGEPSVANDPYALPGHVIHVSVDFDQGATRVNVESKDVDGAKELLRRAIVFAAEAK